MFKRGTSPPDRLSRNLTPPAERTVRLFARSGYKMLREMDKVKYYQLGLVSCGLITHYDSKGDPNWMFLDHTPEFGSPGVPSFESMFRNEVQEISKAWAAYCEHIKSNGSVPYHHSTT